MKKINNTVKYGLCILLCLVALSGCIRNDRYVVKKVKVELVNGNTKIVKFRMPEYATLQIHSHRGSYYLSTWEYCLGEMVKCEVTLMEGVVYYEIID